MKVIRDLWCWRIEVYLIMVFHLGVIATTELFYQETDDQSVELLDMKKTIFLTECIMYCRSLKSLSSYENQTCRCYAKRVKKKVYHADSISTYSYIVQDRLLSQNANASTNYDTSYKAEYSFDGKLHPINDKYCTRLPYTNGYILLTLPKRALIDRVKVYAYKGMGTTDLDLTIHVADSLNMQVNKQLCHQFSEFTSPDLIQDCECPFYTIGRYMRFTQNIDINYFVCEIQVFGQFL